MITYDYYRIFYFVAQYKSFTKAAVMLNNNQPNITRCMNNLENELNCRLFLRSNKGVKLTPEGKKLYEHIAIAYHQIALGEEEIKISRTTENGLVTIGASETALHLFLLDKLEIFHERYPHVKIRISNHSTPQAIRALKSNYVDLAVVTSPLTVQKPIQRTALLSFREILLGGVKYKALAAQPRSLHDLTDIPMISLGEDSGTREMYNAYFMKHNLPFAPDMEAATMDQVLPMLQHNLGIGFYPESLAAKAIARGEVFPIFLTEPLPEREVCVLHDSSLPQNGAANKLMTYLLG